MLTFLLIVFNYQDRHLHDYITTYMLCTVEPIKGQGQGKAIIFMFLYIPDAHRRIFSVAFA